MSTNHYTPLGAWTQSESAERRVSSSEIILKSSIHAIKYYIAHILF